MKIESKPLVIQTVPSSSISAFQLAGIDRKYHQPASEQPPRILPSLRVWCNTEFLQLGSAIK